MSGNSSPRLIGWIAAIVLWAGASGCTVIGFTAGSLADRTAARPEAPRIDSLREAQGWNTALRLADGRGVGGRLARIDCADDTTLVLVVERRGGTFADRAPLDSARVPLSAVSSFRTPRTTARLLFTMMGMLCDITAAVALATQDHPFSPNASRTQ